MHVPTGWYAIEVQARVRAQRTSGLFKKSNYYFGRGPDGPRQSTLPLVLHQFSLHRYPPYICFDICADPLVPGACKNFDRPLEWIPPTRSLSLSLARARVNHVRHNQEKRAVRLYVREGTDR